MAKRGAELALASSSGDTGSGSISLSSGPSLVKKIRSMDPATSFTCSNSEELDMNVLKFQNKMLTERLVVRQKKEADLRQRIEKAENKQTSSEAMVYVINRYWNQLNEDVRILLQRFDAEISDESENKDEEESTTSFLTQLSSWDSEEMSEQLQQRVDASTRAIMKVVQAFDRIVQRNSKVTGALAGEESLEEAVKAANTQLTNENKNLQKLTTKLHEQIRLLTLSLSEANDRATQLEKENNDLQDNCWDSEVKLNRLRHREEQLEKNIDKANERIMALEAAAEAGGAGADGSSPRDVAGSGNNTPSTTSAAAAASRKGKFMTFGRMDSMTQAKLDELQKELQDQTELAENRLNELKDLNDKHKDLLQEIEKLKMNLQCLPGDVVTETVEYKCLQSHFSVLYNETMQIKSQLEESKQQLQTAKNNHLRQIEHMESEELSMQRRLRTEVIQLEDNLAQVRREHEILQLEFKQVMAANEQTGPINREMRNLITSLQNHNGQLKVEVNRWKKKLKDKDHEIGKLRHENEQLRHGKGPVVAVSSAPVLQPLISAVTASLESSQSSQDSTPVTPKTSDPLAAFVKTEDLSSSGVVKDGDVKDEPASGDVIPGGPCLTPVKKEVMSTEGNSSSSSSVVKSPPVSMDEKNARAFNELKAQLKELKTKHENLKSMYEKVVKENKELRKQVASAKSAPENNSTSSSTSAPLSTSSSQSTSVVGDTKAQSLPQNEDPLIPKLKEKIRILEKMIQNQKQQQQQHEDALLSEMEVTGTAFENMQEQNLRMIQQLREKDDANFKLMSERIKSQQIQKLLKEEKESLTEQVIALNAQVEAQNQVVRKLEDKERLIQSNLVTIEKELACKEKAMEAHKRKAIEAAQTAADLSLHLEKYRVQLKEAQATVAEKTSALQQSSYDYVRLSEEASAIKKKLERAKKFEETTVDEVLMEEIREYKSQLTCSACKTRSKNAVLTRCFHVFCFDCIQTRYENRDRKCPKCNATFGVKDYHRLYLA